MLVRRDLALLCLATAASSTAATMLVLAVPLMALEYGLGASGVGLVVSSAFVLPLLFAVPSGRVVDHFGARTVLLAGFALSALAFVPALTLPGLTALVITHVLTTLGQLASTVASQALVADLGRGTGRESAYGWWTTSVAFGQFVGPLIGGIVLDTLPRYAAFLIPLVFLLLALTAAWAIRTRANGSTGPSTPLASFHGRASVLRDRGVAMAILTSSAALWAMTVYATYFPVRLTELHVPAIAIGALLSLRALASVAIRPLMTHAVRLLGGREATVVLTLVALGLGLAGLGLTISYVAFALISVVMGIASGLSQPVSMVMVADRVAPRDRGTVLGIRLMGNRMAQLCAPIALILVAERLGLAPMFVAHGAVVLLAGMALHRLVRRQTRE